MGQRSLTIFIDKWRAAQALVGGARREVNKRPTRTRPSWRPARGPP